MTTTIGRFNELSLPGGLTTSRNPDGSQRDRGSIRPDVYHELGEIASSPGAAFLSGARAILPVLLVLLPFGLALGAAATCHGLSAVQVLGMSVLVFASVAQLAAVLLAWRT